MTRDHASSIPVDMLSVGELCGLLEYVFLFSHASPVW